jgi:hypothetical protein
MEERHELLAFFVAEFTQKFGGLVKVFFFCNFGPLLAIAGATREGHQ